MRHSRKSAVRPRFDGTPTLGRRIANPPQDTILPHKTPAFIPSLCAPRAHPKQLKTPAQFGGRVGCNAPSVGRRARGADR